MKKELIFDDDLHCYNDYKVTSDVYIANIEDEIEDVEIGDKEFFVYFDVKIKDDNYDWEIDWRNVIATDNNGNTVFDLNSKINNLTKTDEDELFRKVEIYLYAKDSTNTIEWEVL